MAKKKMLYTQNGYNELVKELNFLTGTKREKIKEDIKVARGFGDLSENAEYDEARNEQAKTEARIKELEEMINNAVIIDESKIDNDIVNIGSAVTVFDEEYKEDIEYRIVGANEANPLEGKITEQSPIGKALIGTRKGDRITVEAPGGLVHLTVVKVARY